jgi:hypothetical protein
MAATHDRRLHLEKDLVFGNEQLMNAQYTGIRACIMILPRRIGMCARFRRTVRMIALRSMSGTPP